MNNHLESVAFGRENPFQGVDGYRTEADRGPSLLSRLAPSLLFYLRTGKIVYVSSRLARAGAYDGRAWVSYSLAVVNALEKAGVKFDVRGLSNVDGTKGPVVLAANHMSTLETFVLPCILRPRRPLTFIVKKSLLDYPWFGHVLRACDPIAVGRKNPREDLQTVMVEGARRLSEGASVVVFPQTTRTMEFDPEKFNSIGAKLAARSGVPLVPLALKTDAWGTGRIIKDFGPIDPKSAVRMHFGPPLSPEGKGDAAHRATIEFISGKFREWENGGRG